MTAVKFEEWVYWYTHAEDFRHDITDFYKLDMKWSNKILNTVRAESKILK